jgi:ribosome-binding factor A
MKLNRVNGEVQRVLAEAIRGEIKDPRISPLTSVVDVYVAPDLKTCKVWVSVLGGDKEREDTLRGLRSAEGFLRSRLAKVVNLRNTPELIFIMDQSIAYGVQMSRKIQEVMDQEVLDQGVLDQDVLDQDVLDRDEAVDGEDSDQE